MGPHLGFARANTTPDSVRYFFCSTGGNCGRTFVSCRMLNTTASETTSAITATISTTGLVRFPANMTFFDAPSRSSETGRLLPRQKFSVLKQPQRTTSSLNGMNGNTRDDNQARPDDLGNDPGQVGADSAGQSGDPQDLSDIADANDESVEELADTDQAYEAGIVEGVEDASDHPERPAHTHVEYGNPEDVPPQDGSKDEAA